MPEYICNTSPLQYLYQLGRLELLPALVTRLIVPSAVVAELESGRAAGCHLPDVSTLPWVTVQQPAGTTVLPLAADLGRGEASVLALALESKQPVIILDDAVARRAAALLGIRFTGTLGILVEAKKRRMILAVAPLLDELDALRFRVSPATRAAVLKLAGESRSST